MTAQELREARDAKPFRPFAIHLADGRTIRISERDYPCISPDGGMIMIHHSDDKWTLVHLQLAMKLEFESEAM
jgi:hypothetical protein